MQPRCAGAAAVFFAAARKQPYAPVGVFGLRIEEEKIRGGSIKIKTVPLTCDLPAESVFVFVHSFSF